MSEKQQFVRRSASAIGIAVAATLALLALDLGSKEWALDALSAVPSVPPPSICEEDSPMQRLRKPAVVWIPEYFELRYAENCGAAFGMGSDMPKALRLGVFGIASVAATVALFWALIQGHGFSLFYWAVPMIVSGALGNFFDRLRHGFVVDFFRFHLPSGWEYPTFNVADITIFIGVVLLFLDGWKKQPPTKEPATPPDAA